MKTGILIMLAIILAFSLAFYIYEDKMKGEMKEGKTQENKSIDGKNESKCVFACRVISYEPGKNVGNFTDVRKILGPPEGMGKYRGSTDVLSLGIGGSVTVGFNVTIVDGPGDDFIVFENPFYIIGTNLVFAELAYVEVSSDGVHFARFPCLYENGKNTEGINISKVKNFAGVHPVMANKSNGIPPCSPQAGGDRFDLSDLKNDSMVKNGLVDLDDIHYIRIIDIPGNGTCFDSYGNAIYDFTGGNGADIDAIAVINYR